MAYAIINMWKQNQFRHILHIGRVDTVINNLAPNCSYFKYDPNVYYTSIENDNAISMNNF